MSEIKSHPKPHREKLEGDEYRKFIESIFIRDNWACRRCGSRRNLTPHHLVKRSQLGGDTLGNVLTLCLPCHEEVERNELKIEVVDSARLFPISDQEKAFGDYAPGRFMWFLKNVRELKHPIPAKGALGLWEWSAPGALEFK